MDNKFWIDEVLKLYDDGYSVDEALRITKERRKEWELEKIRGKDNGETSHNLS